MTSINSFSIILDDCKTNLQNIYDELNCTINNLNNTNKQLIKENKELNISKQDIEEELSTFKKSSLVAQLNKQLHEQKSQMIILEQQVNHYKANVNTFSKKVTADATIVKLNNDIIERDRYIAILESKVITEEKVSEVKEQVKELVKKEFKEEVKKEVKKGVKKEVEEEDEEQVEEVEEVVEEEYEIIIYNKKKYYLVGKKVYKINKDKTIGDFFGRFKNGEIINPIIKN